MVICKLAMDRGMTLCQRLLLIAFPLFYSFTGFALHSLHCKNTLVRVGSSLGAEAGSVSDQCREGEYGMWDGNVD